MRPLCGVCNLNTTEIALALAPRIVTDETLLIHIHIQMSTQENPAFLPTSTDSKNALTCTCTT